MKRLLVIRLGALGDLIHLTPSLAAVKAAHPDMELHLLTSETYRELGEMMPALDRLWTWRRGSSGESWLSLARRLAPVGFDGIVNLHPSLKTALLAHTLQAARGIIAPLRIAVYHKEKLRPKGIRQRAIPRRHAVDDFYQPFRRLLSLPELAESARTPQLNLIGGDGVRKRPENERWIGIIPGVGGKRANRAWELTSYFRLMAQLLANSPNTRILLIGGPDEKPLVETLIGMLTQDRDRVEDHCGRYTIAQTASLLAQCDRVIGGDTGPTHLAAAVGAPLIALYGPTSIHRTGPLGSASVQCLTPSEHLDCWPCEAPLCPLNGEEHLACMRGISVDAVLHAVHESPVRDEELK